MLLRRVTRGCKPASRLAVIPSGVTGICSTLANLVKSLSTPVFELAAASMMSFISLVTAQCAHTLLRRSDGASAERAIMVHSGASCTCGERAGGRRGALHRAWMRHMLLLHVRDTKADLSFELGHQG